MRFGDVPRMKQSTLKRFLRLPRFDEHLALHRLDVLSSNRRLESYNLVQEKLQEFSEERLRPPRLISGEDLIAAGYEPGPRFSEILTAVEDAQLERLHQQPRGSDGAGAREVPDLKWGGPPGLPWFSFRNARRQTRRSAPLPTPAPPPSAHA